MLSSGVLDCMQPGITQITRGPYDTPYTLDIFWYGRFC